MHGLSDHSLQLCDDPPTGSTEEVALESAPPLSPLERERAEQLACFETWRTFPPRHPTAGHEPYSLDWFKHIEQRRYSRHGYWLPRHLEFHRHRGEQVLGLGEGLGTDWIQYALNGASVHYGTPSAKALEVVQQHFKLRRLSAQFFRAPLSALPLPTNGIDVVCLSALSTGLAEPLEAIVDEVFRVLKPGGKVIAVLPAKYDARWWQDFWFPWNRWMQGRQQEQAGRWSGSALNLVFKQFSVERIQKRHLRRSDLPHIWRWMLLPGLERIMGRFLILKAFKPLSAGLPIKIAA